MLFIRQSPMLISTPCRVSFPRLGARALAARTTELSPEHVRVRLSRIGAEHCLQAFQHGEETVVEIPLPQPARGGVERSICCYGLASFSVTPTCVRLDVQVARFGIRARREPVRYAEPRRLKGLGKGAGR